MQGYVDTKDWKGLSTNLISFPTGRIGCFEGELCRIYAMMVGCCTDKKGNVIPFRIPLAGDSDDLLFYDGVAAYNTELDSRLMTEETFKKGFPGFTVRVKPIKD